MAAFLPQVQTIYSNWLGEEAPRKGMVGVVVSFKLAKDENRNPARFRNLAESSHFTNLVMSDCFRLVVLNKGLPANSPDNYAPSSTVLCAPSFHIPSWR